MEMETENGQNFYESQPVMQGMPQQGHNTEGSLRYQIDSNDIVTDIIKGLRAQVFGIDNNGNPSWKTPEGIKPLINELGINRIETLLRTRLTKIFILSDLEKKDVENISLNLGRNVIDDLYYNWDKYEIEDTAAASAIVALLTDSVYATLRKGCDGTYLKFLRTTHSIQEIQHQSLNRPSMQQGDQGGFINKLLGKKKRW